MNQMPNNPSFDSVSQRIRFSWGNFLTGVTLSLGLFLILGFIVIWIMMLLPTSPHADGIRYEYLSYTLDGKPIISQILEIGQSRYFDLQMQPLDLQSHEANGRLSYLAGEREPDFLLDGSKYQVVTFGMSKDPENFWYFLMGCDKPKFGYFEAVHPMTKRTSGYFGKNGWQLTRPEIESQFDFSNGQVFWMTSGYNAFHQSGREPYVNSTSLDTQSAIFVLDGIAHLINLNLRTIEQLSPTKEVISATPIFRAVPRISQGNTYVDMERTVRYALRTADQIIVVNKETGSEQIWNLTDPRLREAGGFFFLSENEMLAEHDRAERIPKRGYLEVTYHRDLFWFNPAGEIIRSETVTLPDRSATAWMMVLVQSGAFLTGAPLSIGIVNLLALPMTYVVQDKLSYGAGLRLSLPYLWPYLAVAVLIAGVSIYFARRYARQHHQALHPAWAVLIAIFGLTGYLGYRWHRHWPVSVLPEAPQSNGTEILVPA